MLLSLRVPRHGRLCLVREAEVTNRLAQVLPAASVKGLLEVEEDEDGLYVLFLGESLEQLHQQNVLVNVSRARGQHALEGVIGVLLGSALASALAAVLAARAETGLAARQDEQS